MTLLSQFKKLITHEDGMYYHIHKLLGIGCLTHFVYRIYVGLQNNATTMEFLPNYTTFLCICMHTALHISSFEFILPQQRNFKYNVIFPEMRLHTMLFAYRAVLTMLIKIYIPYIEWLTGFIVFATMVCADGVSIYFRNNKYNNGTMMRNNAYSDGVLKKYAKEINTFYAVSQILATANILYGTTESAFLTLLPIQIAPFLMTLVKKGFLHQTGWHIWYTLALLTNYYWGYKYGLTLTNTGNKYKYWLSVLYVVIGRVFYGINKYKLWSAPIVISIFT